MFSDSSLTSHLCCSGAAALRTGADSVHIFCEAPAAAVIRNYSSELVIHPVLDQEYGMEEVDAWLPRLDCVVIGPGLGRNQSMLGRLVTDNNIFLVLISYNVTLGTENISVFYNLCGVPSDVEVGGGFYYYYLAKFKFVEVFAPLRSTNIKYLK